MHTYTCAQVATDTHVDAHALVNDAPRHTSAGKRTSTPALGPFSSLLPQQPVAPSPPHPPGRFFPGL